MTAAKIEVTIGAITFSGEGSEDWLAKQLDKVIKEAPGLSKIAPPPAPKADAGGASGGGEDAPFTDSLASYIKAKGGDSSQLKRFLATADWLRRKGDSGLKTATVSKALSVNHQKKLANPSQCLANNVSAGFCEKGPGGTFFITPDGTKDLGSE